MEEKEQLLAQVGLHQGDLDQYLEIADYAQEKIYIKFQDAIGRNHYKRRWLYELIQNAVDSDEHNPVNVKVSLFSLEDKWKLEFEHDGGLFKPFDKNLHKGHDFKNFILAKSGKSPTDDRIGKFGTGFLSTHCLANIIKIEGLCLEESGEQKLKSVTLDRTEFYGDDDDSIKLRTLKIVKSLKEYDSSSVEPKDNFPSAKFTYYLTKEGLSNAEEGLKEIDISIQFVLACNPRLKSVTVLIKGVHTVYENGTSEPYSSLLIHSIKVGNDVRHTLIKNGSFLEGEKEIELILLKPVNQTEEGFEFFNDHQEYQAHFDKNMPSIYCAYPLIGSEDFQFPVIINSQKFKPNQERNGIQHNESSDLNNQIINKAVELCESFLKESIERYIGNVHYLLKTPNKFDFGDNHWINREWYKNLISSLREKILSVKMIRTFKDPLTKVSILDESNNPTVYFLSNELVKKLGSKLDEFVSEFSKIYPTLPLETEIRDWQSILWEDKSIVQIDLKAVVEKISSFKNLKAFANSVKSEKAPEPDDALEKLALSLINSLCEYITLCDPDNKDSYLSHKKDNIEYGFLPSRSGDFKLFNELLMDVGCFSDRIGEELLDIHQNFYPDRDDYRNSLIHHEIMARTDLAAKKEEESVIQEILKEVEDNLKSHTLIVKAMEEGKIIEKPKRDLIESNLGDFWEWATEFDIKEEHVKDSVRRRILQTIIDPRKSKFLTANLALDRSGKLSLERQSEILSDEELNEKLIQGQIMLDAIKNENEKFETLKKIGKYFESLMKDILHESFGPEQVQHVDGNQDFIIEDIHIELKSTKINQILMHPEQAETAQIKKTQYYLAVFGYDKDYQEVTKEEFKNGVRFTNDIGEKLDGIVVNMGSCESGDENVQVLFPDVYKSFDGMKKYKYVVKKAAWGSMNFDEFVNEVMK